MMEEVGLDRSVTVSRLLADLKSICLRLEMVGIDSLVFCTGSDQIISSNIGRQFVQQAELVLSVFKRCCEGERNQIFKQDGTSTDTGERYTINQFLPHTKESKKPDIQEENIPVNDNFAINGKETIIDNHDDDDGDDDYAADTDEEYSSVFVNMETGGAGSNSGLFKSDAQVVQNRESEFKMVTLKPVMAGVVEHEEELDMKGSLTLKVVKVTDSNTAPAREPFVVVNNENWDFLSLEEIVKKQEKGGYKCAMCGKGLRNISKYREHCTKFHRTKIGYRCLCKQFFSEEDPYKRHSKKCEYNILTSDNIFASENAHTKVEHCHLCDSIFTSETALEEHIKEEHSCEKKHFGEFPCEKCGIVFAHINLLKQHNENIPKCDVQIKSEEEAEKDLASQPIVYTNENGEEVSVKYGDLLKNLTKPPFTCEICNFEVARKFAFSRHLLSHVTKKTHECPVCGTKMKGKEGMFKHMKKHIAKPYKCDDCNTTMATEVELKNHKMTGCQVTLQCELCDYVSSSVSALQTHMNRHSGNKPFACSMCDKGFVSKAGLDRHFAALHSDEKPFKCPTCGKAFKVRDNVTKHVKIHQEPKYTCELCGKKCTEMGNMKKHMRTHTKEKPYVCEICGKKYGRKSLLENHFRLHTGDKPYKCTLESCGKSFRCYSNLQQHIRNHSKEHPFICDVCGKGFKQPGRLNHHRKGHSVEFRWPCAFCPEKYRSLFSYKNHLARIHPDRRKDVEETTNIKLFQCTLCPRLFGDKEDLNRHTYIHKNEKPFRCRHCGKGFNDKSNMRQHEKTHTGEKNHFCEVCNKGFIHKRDLRSHLQSNHSGSNQDRKRVRKIPAVPSVDETAYIDSYRQGQMLSNMVDSYAPDPLAKTVVVQNNQKEPQVIQDAHIHMMQSSSSELMHTIPLAAVQAGTGHIEPFVLIGSLQVYDNENHPQHQYSIQDTKDL